MFNEAGIELATSSQLDVGCLSGFYFRFSDRLNFIHHHPLWIFGTTHQTTYANFDGFDIVFHNKIGQKTRVGNRCPKFRAVHRKLNINSLLFFDSSTMAISVPQSGSDSSPPHAQILEIEVVKRREEIEFL